MKFKCHLPDVNVLNTTPQGTQDQEHEMKSLTTTAAPGQETSNLFCTQLQSASLSCNLWPCITGPTLHIIKLYPGVLNLKMCFRACVLAERLGVQVSAVSYYE